METVGRLIEKYEERNHPISETSPIACLDYLMKEHNLQPSDMSEIGNHELVVEILTEKRALTIEQIKQISQRFQVSPLVFI